MDCEENGDGGVLEDQIREFEERMGKLEEEYDQIHELRMRAEEALRSRVQLKTDAADQQPSENTFVPRPMLVKRVSARNLHEEVDLERCALLRFHDEYHAFKDYMRFVDVSKHRSVDIHLMLGRIRVCDQRDRPIFECAGEALVYVDCHLPTRTVRFGLDWAAASATTVVLQTALEARRLYEFIQYIRYDQPVWMPMNVVQKAPSPPHSFSFVPYKLFVGTWNIGGAMPPASFADWLGDPQKSDVDVYVLAFQEAGMVDKKVPLLEILQNFFGLSANVDNMVPSKYTLVLSESLWELRLFVLVKVGLRKCVKNVCVETKATGKWGLMGNKGAVVCGFDILSTRLSFVSCHLAARKERLTERNESLRLILETARVSPETINPAGGSEFAGPADLCSAFDVAFVFGDLNYRTEIDDFDAVVKFAEAGKYEVLKKRDQLAMERRNHRALCNFTEGEISFRPTYRYNRGELTFSREKLRHPSYCDRVLWHYTGDNPEQEPQLLQYAPCETMLTSDHLPVMAKFSVSAQPTFLSFMHNKHPSCTILFSNVRIEPCGSEFSNAACGEVLAPQLVMDGPFLDKLLLSAVLPRQSDSMRWDDSQIPAARPTIPQTEYLRRQCIVVALVDGDREVAACRVPLRDACEAATTYEVPMTRGGLLKGVLKMQVLLQWAPASDNPIANPVAPSSTPLPLAIPVNTPAVSAQNSSYSSSPSGPLTVSFERSPHLQDSSNSPASGSPRHSSNDERLMMLAPRVRSLSLRTRTRSSSVTVPQGNLLQAQSGSLEVRSGRRLVSLIQNARNSLKFARFESSEHFTTCISSAIETMRDRTDADKLLDARITEWMVQRRRAGALDAVLVGYTDDAVSGLVLDLVDFMQGQAAKQSAAT
jgi:hypothetical protein